MNIYIITSLVWFYCLSPQTSFQDATTQTSLTSISWSDINDSDYYPLFIDDLSNIQDRLTNKNRPNLLILKDMLELLQKIQTPSIKSTQKNQLTRLLFLLWFQLKKEDPIFRALNQISWSQQRLHQNQMSTTEINDLLKQWTNIYDRYYREARLHVKFVNIQLLGQEVNIQSFFPTQFPDTIFASGTSNNQQLNLKFRAYDASLNLSLLKESSTVVVLRAGGFSDHTHMKQRAYISKYIFPLLKQMGFEKIRLHPLTPHQIPIFESLGFVDQHDPHKGLEFDLLRWANALENQLALSA